MDYELTPSLEVLNSEPVLVQAWKKTSDYMRYHNWYADTLEIDYQSIRLPYFIKEISKELDKKGYTSSPLHLVPAPKSHKWEIHDNTWGPREGQNVHEKMRPLSHVCLKDQVVATAIMLLLADRVETLQGDPALSVFSPENRKNVVSYGNRLFCDREGGFLRHRWGSAKTYRQYYTDYQTFLNRPEIVVRQCMHNRNTRFEYAIIQCDLSKFYDRVSPKQLVAAIKKTVPDMEESLSQLVEQLFAWRWDTKDQEWVTKYAKVHEIDGFDTIALPQGLVSAGFFANLVLLDFDDAIREYLGEYALSGYKILDYCRYVDDIRIVARIPKRTKPISLEKINQDITSWLQNILYATAKGLKIETSKTCTTVEGREDQFLVPQSKIANRIQRSCSCTIDMLKGTELISEIEGFFFAQNKLSPEKPMQTSTTFTKGISDLRDDTAARFAAGKFRRVFRSLRPLLDSDDFDQANMYFSLPKLVLTKEQLDTRAELFSLMLIERWVEDPSNIRLVRIALDLYPCAKTLKKIIEYLRDGWNGQGEDPYVNQVKLYCLSEIFRAAAVETGIVNNTDCLPEHCDLHLYHSVLYDYACEIMDYTHKCPWYLTQQIYLYLIAQNKASIINFQSIPEKHNLCLYKDFIGFINGNSSLRYRDRCHHSILAYSAFGLSEVLRKQKFDRLFFEHLATSSPQTAQCYWDGLSSPNKKRYANYGTMHGLCRNIKNDRKTCDLPYLCHSPMNPFLNEINLLYLARFIVQYLAGNHELLSPWQILYNGDFSEKLFNEKNVGEFLKIDDKLFEVDGNVRIASKLFVMPTWVESQEHRISYTLGMVLRFALIGNINYYGVKSTITTSAKNKYTTPVCHWLKKRYGSFNGRNAFAPDWLPLSSWMERFLMHLLQWPGCKTSPKINFGDLHSEISNRISELEEKTGAASKLLFLEQDAPLPYPPSDMKWHRSLRIGIVQSVLPNLDTFKDNSNDVELNDNEVRKKLRQHLVSIISGIEQMLRIRITHRPQSEEHNSLLDLLVFPEIAVHPDDVRTILLPFVRRYRCIILCGLVFHKLNSVNESKLINSALWLIPEWSKANGLQIKQIQQGKYHLTDYEKNIPNLIPFRPAQWIVNYKWNSTLPPLKITAAVCYDSTDLALASDLKSKSDLFIVCAHNKDVGTFDRMSESLHYHMYQGIVIVNNGKFGGSNFYIPHKESYDRQLLHVHGQPQAQISFAEINPQDLLFRGGFPDEKTKWKTPPADWKLRRFFD